MLILKRLLLGAATLILVETAAVTPAQAFTLSFQSTDGKVTGNIINENNWPPNPSNTGISTLSITGQGWSFIGGFYWFPGMQIGNQWFFNLILGLGHVEVPLPGNSLSLPNVEPVNNMPPGFPRIWSFFARNSTNPSLSLLCHSDSDCLGDSGAITLNMSVTSSGRVYSWVGYSGQIQVTAWNPTGTSIPITPLPTNSVPEPSSVFGLLLLGTGWLVKDLKPRFF